MIILDTHIWIWWAQDPSRLSDEQEKTVIANEPAKIGVSAISLWEIAKLVQYGRLELPRPIDEWFGQAVQYPGIRLINLTPGIVVASTRLPGEFHRDPADQNEESSNMVTAADKILMSRKPTQSARSKL